MISFCSNCSLPPPLLAVAVVARASPAVFADATDHFRYPLPSLPLSKCHVMPTSTLAQRILQRVANGRGRGRSHATGVPPSLLLGRGEKGKSGRPLYITG